MEPRLTLDEALDALLHRRSYRAAFQRGDVGALDLTAEDLESLQTIDPKAIERSARRIAAGFFRRSHRGTGTLVDEFPETISAWQGAHPGAPLDELALDVLDSHHFNRYQSLTFGDPGLSIEEVFFLYAESAGLGDPDARESEFVRAIIRALAISPSPSFLVPSRVRRAPGGFFAVLQRGPELVAAVSGKLIQGKITPFLAAILASDASAWPAVGDEIARQFGVSEADLSASLAELRRLGLIA